MKNYFYKLVSNYNGKPVILDEQFTREDARASKQTLKKSYPDVQIVQQKTIECVIR